MQNVVGSREQSDIAHFLILNTHINELLFAQGLPWCQKQFLARQSIGILLIFVLYLGVI